MPAPRAPKLPLRGFLDEPLDGDTVSATSLVVRGWHVWGNEPALAVAVTVGGHTTVVPTGLAPRPDVAEALGDQRFTSSGWAAVVDLAQVEMARPDISGGRIAKAQLRVTVWGALDAQPIELPEISVRLTWPDSAPVPSDIAAPRLNGFLDPAPHGALERGAVNVWGWAMSEGAPANRIELFLNDKSLGAARLGLPRPDVQEVYGSVGALISGFERQVDFSDLPQSTTEVKLSARAWFSDAGPVEVAEQHYRLRSIDREHVATDARKGIEEPGEAPIWEHSRRAALLEQRRTAMLQRTANPRQGPLNLAVFTHNLGYGGAQLWLSELLRQSRAGSRFACTVISPASGALMGQLEASGIEVHISQDTPVRDIESYEGRVTELSLWLATRGHNAILVNSALAFIGADVAERVGLPIVWGIHESFEPGEFLSTAYPPGYVDRDVRRAFERVIRSTHALVFEANATRQLYESAARPNRTVVVPYGIDIGSIETYMARISKAAAREAVGIPTDARVLLAMGTFEPRKAQTVIAEAFARVADKFEDVWLVLVGDNGSPYAISVREFVEQRGFSHRTLVVPVVEDIYQWYRASDIFICTSDIESLPRSVLEAMCFGLVIAATPVFGLSELLTDGATGYLFAPRDIDAATSALHRIFGADPADVEAVALAGRQLVKDRYDSKSYSHKVIGLIEGLRADPSAFPERILAGLRSNPT